MKTNRLDWDISQANKYLFALTKSLLMSEINKFEKTL